MPLKQAFWKISAVVFMVFFMSALGIRAWTSSKTVDYLGPTHIAGNGTLLFIHLNGDMIKLDGSGKLLGRYSRKLTGFDRPPIDLRLLSDGRLLYAEQQPARIRLCNTDSWRCDELGKGLIDKFKREYKVWVDEQHSQLLLTDAAGGGIWVQPLSGGEAAAIVSPVCDVVNDLTVTPQGRIWVADSGQRRLIELAQSTASAYTPAPAGDIYKAALISREISTKNDFVRAKRDFPMMLAQDKNGNLWVTQVASKSGSHSDILVYAPDNGVKTRVDLPLDVFAFDITPMGNHMIASELDGYKLHSIDTGSYEVSEFGDKQFKALMRQTQNRYIDFRNTSDYAMIAMVAFAILMILSAVFATPKDKRWSPRAATVNLQSSEAPMPNINGIYWLKRSPGIETYLKWIEPVYYIIMCAIIAMLIHSNVDFATMTAKADNAKAQRFFQLFFQMSVFMTVMVALAPINARILFNTARRILGTDGTCLYIKLPGGQQVLAHPKDLLYTKTSMAFKQYTLPLQNGHKKPYYAEGELQNYISPLLKEARKVNQWQLYKHMWEHRNPVLIFGSIYFLTIWGGLFWFWLRIKGYI